MSIEKLGPALWLVRGRTKPDPRTGKRLNRKRRVHGPKAAAVAEEARIAAEVPNSPDLMTFQEWAGRWLANLAVADGTREYYRRGIGDACAYLGQMRLSAIRPIDVEDALRAIGPGHVRRRCRKAVSGCLRRALRSGMVESDIMARVDVPDGCKPPSRDRYTPEESRAVLNAVRGDAIEPAVALSMLCGLRREECCGLTWSDVDLERGVVHIRRARVEVEGREVVKPTKTAASVRDVPIGPAVVAILAPHAGAGPVVPMRPSSLSQRFSRVTERAGIRRVRFGNLRHTFATAAIESGMDQAALQAVMGHAKFSTTAGYVTSLHVGAAPMMARVADLLTDNDGRKKDAL